MHHAKALTPQVAVELNNSAFGLVDGRHWWSCPLRPRICSSPHCHISPSCPCWLADVKGGGGWHWCSIMEAHPTANDQTAVMFSASTQNHTCLPLISSSRPQLESEWNNFMVCEHTAVWERTNCRRWIWNIWEAEEPESRLHPCQFMPSPFPPYLSTIFLALEYYYCLYVSIAMPSADHPWDSSAPPNVDMLWTLLA